MAAGLRALIERQPVFNRLQVKGEVSNLTRHASGHVYFSLKDSGAQINAVMFKGKYLKNRYKDFSEGDEVIAEGALTIYPPRSVYQIQVEALRPAGRGQLYEQFLRLKARLQDEGLFDPARKRALPEIPSKVAVITSPTGAAIRDVLHTLQRRFPALQVALLPALVQGENAPEALINALALANSIPDVEAVMLTRGGGSLEDLWAFNDEALARAIAVSEKPVVAAVGHESDFTIAEFAADKRAPTPTAAAELLSPDIAELRKQLSGFSSATVRYAQRHIFEACQRLDTQSDLLSGTMEGRFEKAADVLNGLKAENARKIFELQRAQHGVLTEYFNRSRNAVSETLGKEQKKLAAIAEEAVQFDAEKMLRLGYALLSHNGKKLDYHAAKKGQEITAVLSEGIILAGVKEKFPREEL